MLQLLRLVIYTRTLVVTLNQYAYSTTAVTVDLFLEDSSSNKFYIVKTSIPGATTLLLGENLSFSNRLFSLKLTTTAGGLSTSTPLSVIIK